MESDPPGPITVSLGPRKKPVRLNVTAEELFGALQDILKTQGIEIGMIEYFGLPKSRGETAVTDICFRGVIEHGVAWENERYIAFHVSAYIKNVASRLGEGPFHLKLVRTRTLDETAQGVGVRTIFNVIARLNNDRTISFLPVIKEEHGEVYA